MFTSEGNTNAKGNTIPGLWEKLIKYKYLAPTQKRLPNALVEGVGVEGVGVGRGGGLWTVSTNLPSYLL